MPLQNAHPSLERATAALSRGDFQHAAALCRAILAREQRQPDARYMLGLAHALQGEREAAIAQWQAVLELRPRDFATLANLGVALGEQGRHPEAVVRLREALAIDPSVAVLHYNLGNSLLAMDELDAAVASFRTALARDSRLADARNNLGVACRRLGRLDVARAEFAAAIAANPRHVDAHCNLGALQDAAGEFHAATSSYGQALAIDPRCTESALRLSGLLERSGRPHEGLEVLKRAAAAAPESGELHYALGVALHRAGELEAASSAYDRAVRLLPQSAAAWRDRGRALEALQRLESALESYERAATLAPEDLGGPAGTLSCSVRTCDWSRVDRALRQLRAAPAGLEAIHPFLGLSVCEDPADQLRIAQERARACALGASPAALAISASHGRVRVAYISADLRDHAVAHLLVGILERHDRERFEVHAVSLRTEPQESDVARRIRRAVEYFHDVSAHSDLAAAQLLRERGIDIAVDLNGYTVGGRLGIFAHRAAPVQVSYLGYAGTLGAPYMDYLIADGVVIPEGQERGYSEQVVRLPHCYLPNDDRREIAAVPSRAEAGLPDEGFVFCAFTNPYKINPGVFDVWMRVLSGVPGSVLWLRSMGAAAQGNLRLEAQRRGVEPRRLIFAPHVASAAEHLGRQALAQLYLDTVPYNAHSTACDALWAGVPVLTCVGRSMASRVAASALSAVGLAQLITQDLGEYERRALQLARDARQLRQLREHLAHNRSRAPLFDTQRYTRALEQAFLLMQERALRGQAPAGFAIEPS